MFDRLLLVKYLVICSEQEHHLRTEMVRGALSGVTELDTEMITDRLEHEIYLLTYESLFSLMLLKCSMNNVSMGDIADTHL